MPVCCRSGSTANGASPCITDCGLAARRIRSRQQRDLLIAPAVLLDEAAAFLQMHPEEVRSRAKRGLIPGAKAGRRWVCLEEDLAQFLRSLYAVRRQALRVTQEKSLCHYANADRSGGSAPPRNPSARSSIGGSRFFRYTDNGGLPLLRPFATHCGLGPSTSAGICARLSAGRSMGCPFDDGADLLCARSSSSWGLFSLSGLPLDSPPLCVPFESIAYVI
jgi:Helix-turn-helix domain